LVFAQVASNPLSRRLADCEFINSKQNPNITDFLMVGIDYTKG
jgi:hypothetical protein